jgi:hypothetical protein
MNVNNLTLRIFTMRVMLTFFLCFFYTLIVGNNFSNELVDSMVIATDHHLYDRPTVGKDYEVAKLWRGEIIHVLEKVKFSDLKGRDRNFIKIKNITGDTGYVVDWVLVPSAVYKKQLDSLSEWKKKKSTIFGFHERKTLFGWKPCE